AEFTTAAINSLTVSQASALTNAQLAAMTGAQVAALSASDLAALNISQIQSFGTQISGIATNVPGTNYAFVPNGLGNGQMESFTTTQLSHLSSAQVAAL